MTVRFADADAYHIRVVLRLKKNARIRLIDDRQVSHLAELENVSSDGVVARIIESSENAISGNRLTVVQGIPKLTKADLIVQKLAELGVAGIIFVPMEHTPYTDALHRISRRQERFQRVAESAAKQCRRLDVPNVAVSSDLKAVVAELGPDTLLIAADEETSGANLRDCMKKAGKESNLAVIIGPEGGFSRKERDFLADNNATLFSLGANILRSETAAIVAASIILYELGEI